MNLAEDELTQLVGGLPDMGVTINDHSAPKPRQRCLGTVNAALAEFHDDDAPTSSSQFTFGAAAVDFDITAPSFSTMPCVSRCVNGSL